MTKRNGHFILLAFDIAALLSIWWVVETWMAVGGGLAGAERFEYFSGIPFMLILTSIPLIHLLAVAEHVRPFSVRLKSWLSRGLVAAFTCTILGSIFMHLAVVNQIEEAGFHYCPELSTRFTLAENKVFVRSSSLCGD